MIHILLISDDDEVKKNCLQLQNDYMSIECVPTFCEISIAKDTIFSLILLDFNLIENGSVQIFEAICSKSNDFPILLLVNEACLPLAIKMFTYGIKNIVSLPCCAEYLMGHIKYYTQSVPVLAEANMVLSSFIGESREIQILKKQILLVAKNDMAVLILGETGTGKSLVARLIHQLSPRREKKFVEENTAAIQDTLIEGELFGTKQGAYTGAITRIGLLEHAYRGSLFLDEITCLSIGMQAKLLHAIDTGEFRPVGDVLTRFADVRIISATNRPLEELKNEKIFRRDLYYRLSGVQLCIPPLRKRKVDIVPLSQYFLNKLISKTGKNKVLTAQALAKLEQHHWPGNIRELSTCIERSFYASSACAIMGDDVNFVF